MTLSLSTNLCRGTRIMDTSPTGHFAYWTVRLLFGHFAYWTFRLLVTSPTRHFAYSLVISPNGHFTYWTLRLLFGHFAYKTVCQTEVKSSYEAIRLQDGIGNNVRLKFRSSVWKLHQKNATCKCSHTSL